MKHFTNQNFKSETEKGVVLIDFYADWCGPCRSLAPIFERVEKELHGKATLGKVNIDTEQDLASQMGITAVPTIIVFKGGKEVKRKVGMLDAKGLHDLVASAG